MCGICGCIDRSGAGGDALRARARGMAGALAHRGPDADGVWIDAELGVALAHRRLSIIDLSPRGAQPMRGTGERYTIVFNGEIYNFRELRTELERNGARFQGDSDTEVILAAFARWGIKAAIPRFNGMFALAVWDAEARTLTLARDRMGEKPLYYAWGRDAFVFGSELKALASHPAFRAEIDPASLALYFRHGYVPAPHTIYRAVHKLPAGTTLTVAPGDPADRGAPEPYWSLAERARAVAAEFEGAGDDAMIAAVEALLADAVSLRMIADVPLGAFLSGGIDSSTVVALMQRASTRPVRTFSIGFAEREHDEAPFARAIAQHLGTDHTELHVTPEQALDLIPRLPSIYDEPFGDSSAIPTTLLSILTRRHVTVALSGDGGDELYGGYTRYGRAEAVWRRQARLPRPARTVAAGLLRGVGRVGGPARRARLQRFAQLIGSRHPAEQYSAMTGYWDPSSLLPGVSPHPTLLTDRARWLEFADPTQSLMYADAMTYLPDDILVKVDRASMSASLEARVPLLDHRVVEQAWALPRRMRVRDGTRKWVLRQVLARHVPTELFDRPKAGFGVPVAAWLRGPLRDWAEALIEPARLADGGIARGPVRDRWREHLAGRADHSAQLWIVLMYQAWRAGAAPPAGSRP